MAINFTSGDGFPDIPNGRYRIRVIGCEQVDNIYYDPSKADSGNPHQARWDLDFGNVRWNDGDTHETTASLFTGLKATKSPRVTSKLYSFVDACGVDPSRKFTEADLIGKHFVGVVGEVPRKDGGGLTRRIIAFEPDNARAGAAPVQPVAAPVNAVQPVNGADVNLPF